jgi:opacity protein-like surface antigen
MNSLSWKVSLIVTLLLTLVIGSGSALGAEAEAEETPGQPGLYVGLGLIYAPSAFDIPGVETSNPFGLDARLGYRVTRRVAVEGQYQFIPGFDLDAAGGSPVATLTANTFTLNGKVYALPDDSFQPYAVGGIGLVRFTGDSDVTGQSVRPETAFAGRVGVGADYYVRPDIVVNVEFSALLPTQPVGDLKILPLVFGLQYRF